MARSLTCLVQSLNAMRDYLDQADLPMQQILCFAHVADRGEIPMADLVELTGVSQSSVSRNVAKLGPGENPREKGHGLIEASEDPYYRKRKIVRLTPRGKELVAAIDKAASRYLKSVA